MGFFPKVRICGKKGRICEKKVKKRLDKEKRRVQGVKDSGVQGVKKQGRKKRASGDIAPNIAN